MQRIIFLLCLITGLSMQAQGTAPVDVYLKQGKDSIYLNNQTIKIKKAPFTLIFVLNNPKEFPGVFVNSSFTKDYYNLEPSEVIPDVNYLPQKVYSEHKYNPNKEIKLNPEFFQYFGYNPDALWNKFDRLIKKNGKIIAYRKVKMFTLVDEKVHIPVEKIRFSVFMIFDVIHKRKTTVFNEEVYRAKAKIKFK